MAALYGAVERDARMRPGRAPLAVAGLCFCTPRVALHAGGGHSHAWGGAVLGPPYPTLCGCGIYGTDDALPAVKVLAGCLVSLVVARGHVGCFVCCSAASAVHCARPLSLFRLDRTAAVPCGRWMRAVMAKALCSMASSPLPLGPSGTRATVRGRPSSCAPPSTWTGLTTRLAKSTPCSDARRCAPRLSDGLWGVGRGCVAHVLCARPPTRARAPPPPPPRPHAIPMFGGRGRWPSTLTNEDGTVLWRICATPPRGNVGPHSPWK